MRTSWLVKIWCGATKHRTSQWGIFQVRPVLSCSMSVCVLEKNTQSVCVDDERLQLGNYSSDIVLCTVTPPSAVIHMYIHTCGWQWWQFEILILSLLVILVWHFSIVLAFILSKCLSAQLLAPRSGTLSQKESSADLFWITFHIFLEMETSFFFAPCFVFLTVRRRDDGLLYHRAPSSAFKRTSGTATSAVTLDRQVALR